MWMGSVQVNTMLGLRPKYDVQTATDKEHMEQTVQEDSKYGKAHYQSYEQSMQGLKLLRGFTAEQRAQPVIMWNWTLRGNKEEGSSDSAYGNRMMEMLAQNGAGLMDVGTEIVQLEGEPEYRWSNIAAVHYPNRGFTADLMSSKWMVKTIQGKSPGDQQNFLTVPFSRTLDLAEVPERTAAAAALALGRQGAEAQRAAHARL